MQLETLNNHKLDYDSLAHAKLGTNPYLTLLNEADAMFEYLNVNDEESNCVIVYVTESTDLLDKVNWFPLRDQKPVS